MTWLSKTLPIAALLSFRMLGLFMLIPIFTLYGSQLEGATPKLLGIALGGYGLSQGLLQIPFGMMSDHYGRKPMVAIGLTLFALGSLLGGLTHSMTGMIIARVLQGSGAIGSVLIALLADVTEPQDRTKAMAVVGAIIGASFGLALIISPSLSHYFGLSGVFYFTTLLAIVGLIILYTLIPTPKASTKSRANDTMKIQQFKQVLTDKQLQRLNLGIFFQHSILTSTFFALPLLLQHQIHEGSLHASWQFYLPLMLGSFIAMVPFIIYAEKKNHIRLVFLSSVALILVSETGLWFFFESFWALSALMFVYFLAFNVLEASLPSLISKQANASSRGCAMGVYSSSQFLGIFAGGALSGLVFSWFGSSGIFLFNGIMALIWLLISQGICVGKK